jgi:hypothetical protein
MSRNERIVAALLLAIAVAGSALIPRLLASRAASVGVALGPGPGRKVVHAPAIPRQPHRTAPPRAASPLRRTAPAVAPVTPVRPVTVTPAPSAAPVPPQHARPPAPTPAGRAAPAPVAPSAGPPPLAARPQPPAQAVPPNPPAARSQPPLARPPHGAPAAPPHGPPAAPPHGPRPVGCKGAHDLERSDHGRPAPQAPPHPVGSRHRGVGHLAPPAAPAASADHEARPKAWAQARGPRGKGSHGPPAPVAHGRGH